MPITQRNAKYAKFNYFYKVILLIISCGAFFSSTIFDCNYWLAYKLCKFGIIRIFKQYE